MDDDPAEILLRACFALGQRDGTDLSTRQIAVLLVCHSDTELLTAGELATHLGITSAAVSAVLDQLERAGLVKRIADTDDRRRALIDVTARGRNLLDRVYSGA